MFTASVCPLSRRLLREHPRREQRDRPPGRTLLLALLPGDPGDVQMRPVVILGEFRQEACCGDAPAGPVAEVGEISEVPGDRLVVARTRRPRPGAAAGLLIGTHTGA